MAVTRFPRKARSRNADQVVEAHEWLHVVDEKAGRRG